MVSIPWEVLPLGYRFRPTDEELINHYLKRKIDGSINSDRDVAIPEVDVCKCEPWDLPDRSLIRSDDSEWFFFSPKDRKYPSGNRSNRATTAGYWKATGKDRLIRSRNRNVIGTKKTLVFHQGRAPKGVRTHWIMHEYRTTEAEFESGDQGGFVLYRLFRKSDERNSSPSEIEGSSRSPLPALSSPGNALNETEPEELGTPPNQVIPSNLLEDQQHLADKSGCSASVKRGESICTTNAASKLVDHEPEVAGELEDQVVQNLLRYFNSDYEQPCLDGFPQNTSPMQTYNDSLVQSYKDSPILSDMDQELYRQLFPDDIAEQESNKLVGTIFSDQEEYSSQVLSTQRREEADSECFHMQRLASNDTSQNPSYEKSHETFSHYELLHLHEAITPEAPAFVATPLLNAVQTEDVFNLYRMEEEEASLALLSASGNPDGHLEIENTTIVTPQQYQPGIPAAESANQDYFVYQNEVPRSCPSTGIRINPRPPVPPLPVPDSSYLIAQQGTTLRRLRLQTTLPRRNTGARQYQMSLISRSGSFVGATHANLKWLMFIILLMSGILFWWCLSPALFSY